jgi:hypothetical protein
MPNDKTTEKPQLVEIEQESSRKEDIQTLPIDEINAKKLQDTIQENIKAIPQTIEIEEKLPHLRPRLVKFCEDILQIRNTHKTQAQCYIDCGYKPKNNDVAASQANRLLKSEKVRTYIEARERALNEKIRREAEIDRGIVLAHYKTIIDNCLLPEHLKEPAWIRIYRETVQDLGKICGLFVDRVKIDQPIMIPDIQKMGNNARKELIAQLEERLPAGTKVN